MTYKQIEQGIKEYMVEEHKWMLECLEIAKTERVSFNSMEEFFSWACPHPYSKPNEYESAYMELIANHKGESK